MTAEVADLVFVLAEEALRASIPVLMMVLEGELPNLAAGAYPTVKDVVCRAPTRAQQLDEGRSRERRKGLVSMIRKEARVLTGNLHDHHDGSHRARHRGRAGRRCSVAGRAGAGVLCGTGPDAVHHAAALEVHWAVRAVADHELALGRAAALALLLLLIVARALVVVAAPGFVSVRVVSGIVRAVIAAAAGSEHQTQTNSRQHSSTFLHLHGA